MKIVKLYLCILLLPFFVACSDDDGKEEEVDPIELSKRVACVDHVETSDYIDILAGNGDYQITLKSIFVDEEFRDIPFEEHVKVRVEGNRIIVERVLLENYYLCARCILTDAKGVKKTFVIENPNMEGLHEFDD